MGLVSYALSGNFKKFNKNVKEIAKKENISYTKMMFKFLDCFRMLKCGYADYLNYELYKKSRAEIKEYVSINDQDKFYEIVSPSEYKKTFSVKPNFLKTFKKYINRDFYTNDQSIDKLRLFLKKHDVFMMKQIDGLGGHNVSKVNSKDIDNIEEFYEKLKKENLFLEEYVIQNSKINKLCPASCNTLRIMTFGYNGKSRIIFATLRVGNGINSVDNFHQGGMGVLVDIETGKLVGNAYDKDLNEYTHHPKTKIKFDGFQIPNWDKIKDLVLEAALVDKHIHVVGWDVAVLEDGATFIEGNRRPGFDLVQVLSKRGRKDMMREILDEINENEGTNYRI